VSRGAYKIPSKSAPTKPQAQKAAEKAARHEEEKLAREVEKEARAATIRDSLVLSPPEPLAAPLSKKDARRMRQQGLDVVAHQSTVEWSAPRPQTASAAPDNFRDAGEAARADVLEEYNEPPARVVQNHSTLCEGLHYVLRRLQILLPGCTITPGPLGQRRSNCESLEIRIQRSEGATHKLVVRSGHTAQDLYIVSGADILGPEALESVIESVLSEVREDPSDSGGSRIDMDLSRYNHTTMAERHNLWREAARERDAERKAHERDIRTDEKVAAVARRLATKGVDPASIDGLARRDLEIVSGKNRGKNAMR
jgi:hypothetical protein